MGIKTTTIHQITCDRCREAIQYPTHDQVVRLSDYGLVLHVECFVTITGPQLLELMGDDDTVVYTLTSPEGAIRDEAMRIRRPTNLQADGRILRSGGEPVEWPFQ